MPQRDRYVSPTNTYSTPYKEETVENKIKKNKKVYFIKSKTKKRLKNGKEYIIRVKKKFKNSNLIGDFVGLYIGGNDILILENGPKKNYNIKHFNFYSKIKFPKRIK